MANILISGGSGLIGKHLQKKLQMAGHEVNILSRGIRTGQPGYFYWDVEKGYVDPDAFKYCEIIIHLAGASIAGQRWTEKYKKELLDSRVKSAELLYEGMIKFPNRIHTFISASGIGIYGDTGDSFADENTPPGTDFMAQLCVSWEEAALKFQTAGKRVVIFRTGIVLSPDGGFLKIMSTLIKCFLGVVVGNGKQYLSTISIEELTDMYLTAVEHSSVKGIYNAVGRHPVTQREFMSELARKLHRPLWPFSIPAFLIKLLLGESACIVLEGQRVKRRELLLEHLNNT